MTSGAVIVEIEPTTVARSPADVLRLAVAVALTLVVLVIQWLFGDTVTGFASDLLRGLDAVPTWLVEILVVGTRVLAIVLIVAGIVVTLRNRAWRLLLSVAVAAGAAAALALLLHLASPDAAASPTSLEHDLGPLTRAAFPSAAGLAAVSAAVTAAAPWLSRNWRRAGWAFVFGVAFTTMLVAPVSFDISRAILGGWVAGAAMVVVFGGPSRRPRGSSIAAGLGAVGLPLARLEQASLDARGSTPYFGTAADGRKYFVKALGEDQRSADVLFRVYRRLVPRDLGDERQFSSLRRAIEHEALVALAARDIGIRTPRVVALATAEPHAFVLAYEAVDGRSLDRVDAAEVDDELLTAIWRQVAALRARRIAHRDLRLANVFVGADGPDGKRDVWMIDFGFSELAARDLLLDTDVAELLAASSLLVGADRAVGAANTVLGSESLRRALDRLHPWALSGATRTALKARPGFLDGLRATLVARTDGAGVP